MQQSRLLGRDECVALTTGSQRCQYANWRSGRGVPVMFMWTSRRLCASAARSLDRDIPQRRSFASPVSASTRPPVDATMHLPILRWRTSA